MYFIKQCAIGLLALQNSFSLAIPTESSQLEDSFLIGRDASNANLQKRYPIALNYDPSVPANERPIIDQAFQDMQALAAAAASYNFANSAGNVDGIYAKYFPQGQEQKIQALFKYLAGINQQWGGAQLTTPDFSGFTIKREAKSDKLQGSCQQTANGKYDITLYDLAVRQTSPSIAALNFRGTKTSAKMESLGAIILHELLHATTTIVNPVMSYSSATDSTLRPLNPTIDDQRLPGYGKCYGGFLANTLKQTDADRAFLNIDNYMYFALEAYYYPILRPSGGFGKPMGDKLTGCVQVFMGFTLFCWNR